MNIPHSPDFIQEKKNNIALYVKNQHRQIVVKIAWLLE